MKTGVLGIAWYRIFRKVIGRQAWPGLAYHPKIIYNGKAIYKVYHQIKQFIFFQEVLARLLN